MVPQIPQLVSEEVGHTGGFYCREGAEHLLSEQRRQALLPRCPVGVSVCCSSLWHGCYAQGSERGLQDPCHTLLGLPLPL